MSVASPMMQEVFSPSLPHLVTPTAASAYLMSLAVANLSGRVVWASVTDRIGSRNTFHILCFGSVPLFASLPPLMISAVSESSTGLANFALAGFCVNSFLAVSIMGGVFSCLPPYEAELYGSRWVGAIHGKFLPSYLPCARRRNLVLFKACWLLLTHNSLLIHSELGLSLPLCSFKEVPSRWQDSLPSFLLALCKTPLRCSTHPPCTQWRGWPLLLECCTQTFDLWRRSISLTTKSTSRK